MDRLAPAMRMRVAARLLAARACSVHPIEAESAASGRTLKTPEDQSPMKMTLRYDMRAPSFGAPIADLYEAAVDQVAWADGLGFNQVFLGEHHGAEDGYL